MDPFNETESLYLQHEAVLVAETCQGGVGAGRIEIDRTAEGPGHVDVAQLVRGDAGAFAKPAQGLVGPVALPGVQIELSDEQSRRVRGGQVNPRVRSVPGRVLTDALDLAGVEDGRSPQSSR